MSCFFVYVFVYVYVMIAESGSHPVFPNVSRSHPTKPSLFFLRLRLLFSFHILHSSLTPIQCLYIYPNHAHNSHTLFPSSPPFASRLLQPCQTLSIPLLSSHPDWSSRRFSPNLNTKATEPSFEEASEGMYILFCISSITFLPFQNSSLIFLFLSGLS